MIRRIVKLTFQDDKVDEFKALFHSRKEKIVSSKGCHSVDLLQHIQKPNVFFTYSFWESEEDLNAYRHSELFAETWAKTKSMFADKPKAWSTECINGAMRDEL